MFNALLREERATARLARKKAREKPDGYYKPGRPVKERKPQGKREWMGGPHAETFPTRRAALEVCGPGLLPVLVFVASRRGSSYGGPLQ